MGNENDLSPNVENFLNDVNAKAEGAYPGMKERLEGLRFEGLGRAIVIEGRSKKDKLTEAFMEKLIDNTAKPQDVNEGKDDLIGYSLPLDENELKHLLILKNGSIYVTTPNLDNVISADPNRKMEEIKERYRKQFGLDEQPNSFPSLWGGVGDWESKYLLSTGDYKILSSNKNPGDIEIIKESIKQATRIAREVKRKKEALTKESVSFLFEELDSLLKGGPEKSNNDNPPIPPENSSPSY